MQIHVNYQTPEQLKSIEGIFMAWDLNWFVEEEDFYTVGGGPRACCEAAAEQIRKLENLEPILN